MKKIVSIICFAFLVLGTVFAADLYVSIGSGNNRNPGTKDKPIKNLQKAINKAAKGDKIFVAEGNYFGLLNKGSLELDKSVEIYGGYSKDFSKRDVLKHQSKIMPPASSNGTSANAGMFYLKGINDGGKVVIDGIIFDKGDSNAYHSSKGKPKGVATGMYMKPPGKGAGGVISVQSVLLGGSVTKGEIVIQNCVFNNGDKHAIQMRIGNGVKATVLNNVFTANLYAAAEIFGPGSASLEFAYNTVLFTWCRTKAMEDMGYGFRCMPNQQTTVHHNIIGLSNLAGLDRTRVDNNQQMDIDHNMFFMNNQADMVLPGAGKFMRIYVDMFEDVEQITSSEGNATLSDAAGKALRAVLNRAYLDGFLSASYTEKVDYDADSSMNQALRALGFNQIGKIDSSVSMYGNRYPLEDAVKLFGVIKGFGAQVIK